MERAARVVLRAMEHSEEVAVEERLEKVLFVAVVAPIWKLAKMGVLAALEASRMS